MSIRIWYLILLHFYMLYYFHKLITFLKSFGYSHSPYTHNKLISQTTQRSSNNDEHGIINQ